MKKQNKQSEERGLKQQKKHMDAKQDKKMIKEIVKKDCMKK